MLSYRYVYYYFINLDSYLFIFFFSEFQQFEKQLEHCLSSTAVNTKFATHTARGKNIIVSSGGIMAEVQDTSVKSRNAQETNKKELVDR